MKRALPILILLSFCACATNPVTKRPELVLMSEAEEIQMGTQQYGPYIQSLNGPYHNVAIQEYVREVGRKITAQSHRKEMPYEFTVVNTSMINAFAVLGGKIVITRGLLERFTNEAQLAAVLGHEVGHITAKHTVNMMAKQWLFNNAFVYTDMLLNLKSPHYQSYRRHYTTAGMLGIKLATLAYSRSQEAQSDELGLEYMVKAGYAPQGMVELQEIFMSLREKNPSLMDELMTTHPLAHKRVAAAKAAIEAKYKDLGLPTYEKEFKTRMVSLLQESPAYQHHDKATEFAAKGQWPQAIASYKMALSLKPQESLFHADLGRAYAAAGDPQASQNHFIHALLYDPDSFKARYFVGQLQYIRGNHQGAIDNLLKARQLLPHSAMVSAMLADSYEKIGNLPQAINHYKDVQSLNPGGELGNQAAQALLRLN